ncbi:MAG: rane protein, partial [Enterobacteriaceae bacterium]|nr:rane protein [Enterobacteriaceae bacterium]
MSTMKPDLVWYPPQFPNQGRWLVRLIFIAGAILLTGCDRPAKAESVSGGSGTIEAINHTHWA